MPALWADLDDVPMAVWLIAAAVLALAALAWLRPHLLVRLGVAAVARSVLWLSVAGKADVPRTGPLVLVCNPLSYLGWLLVDLASPRRVRFVVLSGWARSGLPGRLLRWAGAITPDGS